MAARPLTNRLDRLAESNRSTAVEAPGLVPPDNGYDGSRHSRTIGGASAPPITCSATMSYIHAVARPSRFEHQRFVGDKRTLVVYDLDRYGTDPDVTGAVDDLLGAETFLAFGPDTLAEARTAATGRIVRSDPSTHPTIQPHDPLVTPRHAGLPLSNDSEPSASANAFVLGFERDVGEHDLGGNRRRVGGQALVGHPRRAAPIVVPPLHGQRLVQSVARA